MKSPVLYSILFLAFTSFIPAEKPGQLPLCESVQGRLTVIDSLKGVKHVNDCLIHYRQRDIDSLNRNSKTQSICLKK